MKIICLGILLLGAGLVPAQSSASKLTFEVASVKLTPPPLDGRVTISIGGDAGRLDWQGVPLKFMIARAYVVQDFQILGPDWLSTQRFELVAKFPEHATERQIPEMLRALLADRFGLEVHKDSKEMQVDALTVAKGGLKVKPVEDSSGQVRIGLGQYGGHDWHHGGGHHVSGSEPLGVHLLVIDLPADQKMKSRIFTSGRRHATGE